MNVEIYKNGKFINLIYFEDGTSIEKIEAYMKSEKIDKYVIVEEEEIPIR